jgi:hypothetical protein
MSTGPLNPKALTGPLRPITGNLPFKETPKDPKEQKADGPTLVGDQRQTSSVVQNSLDLDVNLDDIDVPDVPETTEAAEKGFLDMVGGWFGSAVEAVEHVVDEGREIADKALDVVTDVATAGYEGVTHSLAEGHNVIEALGDGLEAAGTVAMQEIADPLLDSTVGEDNAANDQAAGALGPLLTNRIPVGGSVDIRIEAGMTLPTEVLGAPNIKLDAGGTLKIKRVLAVDENNQPILNPDGSQQTRLEVELKIDGRVAGEYSASIGASAQVAAGNYEAGFKAEASASAEAGLTGSVSIKLRFNPDDPNDMDDLLAFTQATAAKGAADAIPGIDALFGGQTEEAYQAAMHDMQDNLEEVSGEGGLYAQASASAELKVGIFSRTDASTRPAALASTENGRFSAQVDQVNAEAPESTEEDRGITGQAHDAALAQLQLKVAQLSASAGVELKIKTTYNFRTGETTYSIQADAAGKAGASVMGFGGEIGGSTNRSVNLVVGPDGQLKDVVWKQEYTKEQFQGVMTTVQDVYGRPLNEGVVAGIGESDTITVNYHASPEMMEKFRGSQGPAGWLEAASIMTSAAITPQNFNLEVGDITTRHRDEVRFAGNFSLALGAEIGVRGGITLGKERETVIN